MSDKNTDNSITENIPNDSLKDEINKFYLLIYEEFINKYPLDYTSYNSEVMSVMNDNTINDHYFKIMIKQFDKRLSKECNKDYELDEFINTYKSVHSNILLGY